MINSGYIYLWRRIVDSSFYKNPNCCHLAIYLLMAARWQSSDIKILIGGQEQVIRRGQVWVGRYKLAENTGLSSRNVRTCLKTLATIGFLTSKPTNKGTLISICKYNDYQNGEINPTSTLTSNRPATDQQPTSNRPHLKKDKKDKKDKQKNDEPVFELPLNLNTPEFQKAWEGWIQHRKEIKKPLTVKSVEMQMKEFVTWGPTGAVEAIEYTIKKGWQGIRRPESETNSKPSRKSYATDKTAIRDRAIAEIMERLKTERLATPEESFMEIAARLALSDKYKDIPGVVDKAVWTLNYEREA